MSEALDRCVEEIDVSVEVECEEDWLCCEQKYLKSILVEKAAQCLW